MNHTKTHNLWAYCANEECCDKDHDADEIPQFGEQLKLPELDRMQNLVDDLNKYFDNLFSGIEKTNEKKVIYERH